MHRFYICIGLCVIYFMALLDESYCVDPQYKTCVPLSCGHGPNISYPFYILGRHERYCGYPGFGPISCSRLSDPVIKLSGNYYVIEDIDYRNRSLRVYDSAVSSLLVNGCFSGLRNISQPKEFDFADNVTQLHLFYNCSSLARDLLQRRIFCHANDRENWALAYEGDQNSTIAQEICTDNVTVWVEKNDPKMGSWDLETALRRGFVLNWTASDCNECEDSGGRCGFDAESFHFKCFCPDRPHSRSCTHVSRSNHGLSNQTRIILGLVFGAIGFTLAFILLTWCWKTRYFGDNLTNPNTEKFLLEQGSLIVKRYRYYEIKKITKSFNDKLGQGGYGSVYKGTLPNGCPVAVKVLIETDSNDEEFINEVASISRTSHVNIVSLLGFCYERKRRALVYEYMPNKSLDKFISDTSTSLSMEKLYDIAVGVAKGLEYLHRGCSTRIIHFDIKPQNILLDECFCPKISDFGLAKLCKKRESILSMLGTRGTIGYIAPEVFSRNFGGVSHKSDVYSYGIMILEMAGARKFMETETLESTENYFPDKIYEAIILSRGMKTEISNKFIVEFEDERARKMFLVGFWCIQATPSDRPTMSKIVEMLEGSLDSIKIPPNPVLFDRQSLVRDFLPSLSVNLEIETSSEDQ